MYDLNDAGPQTVPGGLAERWRHSAPGLVTAALKLMNGRQNEILAALGVTPPQRGHMRCPLPTHEDRNPSFRWDGDRWYCTCGSGDALDLIIAMGMARDTASAALWARDALGCHVVKPAPSRQPVARRDPKFDIETIASGCKSLAGTEGETYFAGRGLNDPGADDLLFHPDLTDFETRRGYCGIVAIVRNGAGEPTGGIHRTFLTDDGSSKAAPGRKMLGPVAGGAVRLRPMLNGSLGIAEGIETALAVMQLFPGRVCWAALSADNIGRFEWPPGVTDIIIYRDAGEAGEKAAAVLAGRLAVAGIGCRVLAPLHGDDFADDLRQGVRASDYERDEVPAVEVLAPPEHAAQAFGDLEAAARRLVKNDAAGLAAFFGAVVRSGLDPIQENQIIFTAKASTGVPVQVMRDAILKLKREYQKSVVGGAAPAWAGQLCRDLFGQLERNEANVITALSNDPVFAGAIVFDEMRQECMIQKPLPWSGRAEMFPRPWADVDDIKAAEWLQRMGINVAPAIVSRSVQAVASDIKIHPVREYLGSLRWDGVSRLAMWVVDYLGANDMPLNRAFGSMWMISAVARVMKPGTKADHMLILEGPQGARKSSALKALAGEDFFTDELSEVGSKDAAMQLRGVWVIEIAELDAFSRSEVTRIKAFLTRTTDRYRPPYGRYVVSIDRQCIFAGTVNHETYLRDETGNRRFWPVRCGDIDVEGLGRARDQLWAEAAHLFASGAIWWLTDPELIGAAREEQDARREPDAWDEKINSWLRNDSNFKRLEPIRDVSISEILQHAIGLEPGRWTRGDQMRISAYLKRNGWTRYRGGSSSRDWRYCSGGVPT